MTKQPGVTEGRGTVKTLKMSRGEGPSTRNRRQNLRTESSISTHKFLRSSGGTPKDFEEETRKSDTRGGRGDVEDVKSWIVLPEQDGPEETLDETLPSTVL